MILKASTWCHFTTSFTTIECFSPFRKTFVQVSWKTFVSLAWDAKVRKKT
ncbi:hypothetical protein AMTR_s00102p00059890 [Amborella trichopoda]|uniref:Uncharacterized protein n=1 Tax=Amborella trichopoda TaxID=13333 RepID=W1NYR7_AMBTC|nr:hypothetical protein AMTR_s00102p00059890 [Amborella trichopoda]